MCGGVRRKKGRDKSRKRVYLNRYLALAACAALIIISAYSLIPNIYSPTQKSAEPQAADTFMANADAPACTEGGDEAEVQSLDGDDEYLYTRSSEGSEATPVPAPEEEPAGKAGVPETYDDTQMSEEQITASYGMAGSGQSVGSTLSGLFSSCKVSLSDPGAAEPFFSYADSQGAAELLGFLGNALDEGPGEVPGEPPTVIIILSGVERSCQLSVWSGGGNILCLYSEPGLASAEKGEEVFFKTDGPAESFNGYIDSLRNPVS